MTKAIWVLIAICANALCYGLPVGNPADSILLIEEVMNSYIPCGPFILRAGYYGDYVFNRHMKMVGGRSGNLKTTKITTTDKLTRSYLE